MKRRRDPPAAGDEGSRAAGIDRHDRRGAEQPAEVHAVADRLSGRGNDAHGGRLVVHHADGRLVRDDGGERLGGRVAGDGDHVEPDGADAGHRLELLDRELSGARRGDHAGVLAHGDERAREPADVAGRHHAALFHRVIEEREGSGRARRADALEPHLLEDRGDAVAHGGRRREGEIHNAERHAEPTGRLLRRELPHARDAKCGLLHRLRHNVERLTAHGAQRVLHHARARYADVHLALRLAHAVERARHEGVVLHRVAEHDELGAGHAAAVGGQLGGALDGKAHLAHGVHVDPRARGADAHARADELRLCQRLRDRGDQHAVGLRHTLLHERGKAAEEVHADLLRRPVEGLRVGDIALRARARADQRDRRHGHALIYDRDAELGLQILARLHEVSREAADLVIDLRAAAVDVRVRAVEQGDAHRDRADVQMLLIDHLDRLQNFMSLNHGSPSDAVHGVENVLALGSNLHAHLLARVLQQRRELRERHLAPGCVHQHDHGEVFLQHGLADVQHVHAVPAQKIRDRGDDAHAVLSDDGDNGSHAHPPHIVSNSSSDCSNAGTKCSRK